MGNKLVAGRSPEYWGGDLENSGILDVSFWILVYRKSLIGFRI